MVPAEWSVVFRPTARAILNALMEGPRSLSDLSAYSGLTKSALVRHLKDLESLGVVEHAYRPLGMSREVVYAHRGLSLHLDIRPPGVAGDPLSGTVLSWAAAGHVPFELPLTAQVAREKDRDDVTALLLDLQRALPEEHARVVVIVFGSVARGEATKKSDLDLLFVLPDDAGHLKDAIADCLSYTQQHVERALQPFFTLRADFLHGRRTVDEAAAREGIIVHSPRGDREIWTRLKRYGSISV